MLKSDFRRYLVRDEASIKEALTRLDSLAIDAILFIVDNDCRLLGSITDGDIRRGLIRGLTMESSILDFMEVNPKVLKKDEYSLKQIIEYRNLNYRAVPVVSSGNIVINVINYRYHKSYLPLDAVIMAGGRGERLKPFTDTIPKPLLNVGDKPIIQHSIERLLTYGIDDFWITLRYLGEQIQDYIEGLNLPANFNYIYEKDPLGTIGALSMLKGNMHDNILLSNSDILTNIDYEAFFMDFISTNSMLSVVSIPYNVDVPYAVLETVGTTVKSFSEKPRYTFQANGGIYLMKKECLNLIPKSSFFNATDLIETLIERGEKVTFYPLNGYWLDIGKHEDFVKAQEDLKRILF